MDAYRAIIDPPGHFAPFRSRDPVTLAEALRMTAARNEQLGAQGERYIQALASRQRAAASLLPTAELFGDVALRENTGDRGIVQTDIGVAGQYRVLTGLSDLRNVDAATRRADSARWLILDLRESLLVQAARTYYESLRAQRLAGVLRSSVVAQSERLADARARNEVGFTRPLDVSQIESQVSRTRAQLITAERQEKEARASLALLTNMDVMGSPLTDGFEIPAAERPLSEFLGLAAEHRQDVLAARAEADAARLLVDAAIGQYAPSLTLNLEYFLISAPTDSTPSLASLLQVRLPLFTAGRIEAEVRGSWATFRERVLSYRLRAREARRDVETAYLRLKASAELASELATQVRVASQAVELAEAAYEAGLGTNLERVIAQDQLLAAELEAVSEAFSTKTAYLELLRACGLLSAEMIGSPLPVVLSAEREPPVSPVLDRAFVNEPRRNETNGEGVER